MFTGRMEYFMTLRLGMLGLWYYVLSILYQLRIYLKHLLLKKTFIVLTKSNKLFLNHIFIQCSRFRYDSSKIKFE